MNLPRSLHWLQGLLLISGAFFVVIYQSGWALAELGSWSLLIWLSAALLGVLQAYWLYRLAQAYPHKAGGTAVYAQEVFEGRSRWLAFVSGWGYWLAWTPATALNSYICASLLNGTLETTFNPTLLAVGIMALLYALNWFGLGRVIASSYLLAFLTFLPLLVLVGIALDTFEVKKFYTLLNTSSSFGALAYIKWFFVIAWTAYGLEMISSVVAETRGNPKPMFGWAAAWSLLAFAGIPFLLALLSDAQTLQNDPFMALRPLFVAYLGPQGATLLILFLVAALLYSALAILMPSTRTIYQMSRDGLLPPYFARLNRYGTPQGSLLLDIGVNLGLLLVFGSSLVSILAVANVGYMAVFVLLPWVYGLFLHRRGRLRWPTAGLLGGVFGFNLLVLLLGSYAWGGLVFWMGWLLLGLGVLLFFLLPKRALSRASDNI
ncbi:Arginine/ornithine antiporter ArcD1 [Meiothermus luteus]|jgi:amino acid transporter|uniref:Arginine/ornithine antiporter ArcD1 n=1 Tax=Meiothermus luteus TaxID=2026184 RepID=A0A399EJ55_9DEIN|nr:APC family permease [Meiothermus luteus]RIH82372.1 Arginine/ornithine antiporter ArcD1 [Meiothermus luteus]RMH57607.1 MAG: amino acid permease [Deinococcota bacterium]